MKREPFPGARGHDDGARRIGVDIVQPMVPSYRMALFEGLEADHKFVQSIQCAAEYPVGARSVSLRVRDYFPDRPIRHLPGGILWQRGIGLIHARAPGDVLVVCGTMQFLSNFPVIAAARARGVSVVWWGHHRSATSTDASVRVRLALARRLADVFLVYTDTGVDTLVAEGIARSRVFAAGNTIDTTEVRTVTAEWTEAELKAFAGTNGLVGTKLLLFCGVLNQKTRLDLALRALARLDDPSVRLAIIGDGVMRHDYQALARALRITDRVSWLGEIRDQRSLAPWFLLARAFAYPGAIGLSLLHAFSYGLPVVTHGTLTAHMPEIEALSPGANGLTFPEGDITALAAALGRILSDAAFRERLSAAARATAYEKYPIEGMIARFKACLVAASRIGYEGCRASTADGAV